MKIRGRRVALLLTGALPILAEEAPTSTDVVNLVKSSHQSDADLLFSTSAINGIASHDESDTPMKMPQHLANRDLTRESSVQVEDLSRKISPSEMIHNEELRLPSYQRNLHLTITQEDNHSRHQKELSTQQPSEFGSENSALKEEPPDNDNLAKGTGMNDFSLENQNSSDPKASNAKTDPESAVIQEIPDIDTKESDEATDSVPELRHTKTLEENTSSESDEEDEEESLSRVSVDYASKSAGALIIEKSKEFKGTSSLLNGDRDKYAIAPCEEKKFVVISLSEDILVKQILLANYERFSSTVKDFQVLGSQTLGKWFDLGTYAAKAGNGEQTFDLVNPAWARYLKFKFLTHHGVEYYCTYSQIKVHGSTMVQGFHEQWEDSEVEEEKQLTIDEIEAVDVPVDIESDDGNIGGINKNNDASLDSNARMKDQGGLLDQPICEMSASKELGDKLQGVQALSDEDLFSCLYDLIPSTLNALPKASRDSPGRRFLKGETQTIILGTMGVQSALSKSNRHSKASKATIPAQKHIVAPQMADSIGGSLIHYLGTELGLLMGTQTHTPRKMTDTKLTLDVPADEIILNEVEQNLDSTEILDESKEISLEKKKASNHHEPQPEVVSSSTREIDIDSRGDENTAEDVGLHPDLLLDPTLLKMLDSVPSAECLSKLDFAKFKGKMFAAKKGHSGSGATSSTVTMEPIFKKLTDEIKSIHSHLAAHDQFTKASVACYQRVLLDLIVQNKSLQNNHEERLRLLEEEIRSSQTMLSYFGIVKNALGWIYSAVVHIYSPLVTWLLSLLKFGIKIPSIIYRNFILNWPDVKSAVLQNRDGSPYKAAQYLKPLTSHLDHLVEEIETAEAKIKPEDERLFLQDNDDMWKFPVIPILLLILIGRLIICFTSPPIKRVKISRNSELRAWQTREPTKMKTDIASALRNGKPRAYSLGAEPSSLQQSIPKKLHHPVVSPTGSENKFSVESNL